MILHPGELGTGLKARSLSKQYGGTSALRDVSIDVQPGTVMALLGGNGSGKSTLIKILAGVVSAERGGSVEVGGTGVSSQQLRPSVAHNLGLRFVHQDLGLIDDMSVADNIALSRGYEASMGAVNIRRTEMMAADLLDRLGIDVHPRKRVADVSPADRTMVAIARALSDAGETAGILVLDEPTARLPDREVDKLLTALRARADAGTSILYVTHRLSELASLADNFTVLRDGSVVATGPMRDIRASELVEKIAGRDIRSTHGQTPPVDGKPLLTAVGLCSGAVRGVDLEMREGEIVGIAGIEGSGKSSLLRAVFGAADILAGHIRYGAQTGPFKNIRSAMVGGVAMVPADRNADAAFLGDSITSNLSITTLRAHVKRSALSPASERRRATQLVDQFRIKTDSVSKPLAELSGGNAQKVIVARWLQLSPKILLLDEPTQGVDVGARSEIYGLLVQAAKNRTSVLIASSDTEELAEVCHRVIVMRKGRFVAQLIGDQISSRRITELCHYDLEGA